MLSFSKAFESFKLWTPSVAFDTPRDLKLLKPELKSADEAYMDLQSSVRSLEMVLKFGCNYHIWSHYALELHRVEANLKKFKTTITNIDKKRDKTASQFYQSLLDVFSEFRAYDYFMYLVASLTPKFEQELATLRSAYPNWEFDGVQHPDKSYSDLFKEAKKLLK